MERQKVFILQDAPSEAQSSGIIACKDKAWRRDGKDFYPYKAFGKKESWQHQGELGQKIIEKHLYVSLVSDESGEVVAHAALDHNKLGWELGRVFARKDGHDYGLAAVDALREHAERFGIDEIARGTSYNRTAVWKTYERSFGAHGWKLAVLGILPDIYAQPPEQPVMQWGEIISRAVKGKDMLLPKIAGSMPEKFRQFAQGIQNINNHCLQFGEESPKKSKQPYRYGEGNTFILAWNDKRNQKNYLLLGYKPVGIIKLDDEWCFVVSKGNLPQRQERRGVDLQFGRSLLFYPKEAGGVAVNKVIDFVYQQ